jgi:transcriptional regulator with XRE-family HTH domain
LHRNYIGGVERGELNPSLASVHKLARAFGVNASELLIQAEQTTDA